MLEAEFGSEVAMSQMLPQVPHSLTEAGIAVRHPLPSNVELQAIKKGPARDPRRKASARGSLRD